MTAPETIAMLALLAAIPFAFGIGLRLGELKRQATPREPNPVPVPRVTPHTLMIDGWREERRAKEFEMETINQAIEDIEAADEERGNPYTLADAWKRIRVRRAREISELDQVLAEDERANR